MRQIHAWDCICGRRSVPGASFCQHCGTPQSGGRPVYATDAREPEPDRVTPFPWACFLWAVVAILAFVLYFVRPDDGISGLYAVFMFFSMLLPLWPVLLVVYVLWLLVRIATATERASRR
jgi:hypothetical protein